MHIYICLSLSILSALDLSNTSIKCLITTKYTESYLAVKLESLRLFIIINIRVERNCVALGNIPRSFSFVPKRV